MKIKKVLSILFIAIGILSTIYFIDKHSTSCQTIPGYSFCKIAYNKYTLNKDGYTLKLNLQPLEDAGLSTENIDRIIDGLKTAKTKEDVQRILNYYYLVSVISGFAA